MDTSENTNPSTDPPRRRENWAGAREIDPLDGRPSRIQTLLAIALVVIACGLIARMSGALLGGVAATAAGVLTAFTFLALSSSRSSTGVRLSGALSLSLTGILLAGTLAVGATRSFDPVGGVVIAIGTAVAVGGAVTLRWDAASPTRFLRATRAASRVGIAYLVVGGAVLLYALSPLQEAAQQVLTPLFSLLLPSPGTVGAGLTAVTTFLVLVAASLLAIQFALARLPVVELLPEGPRRDRARERLGRFRRVAYASVVLPVLVRIAVMAANANAPGTLTAYPSVASAIRITSLPAIRAVLLVVIIVSLGLGLGARGLQRASAADRDGIGHWIGPIAGGALIPVIALVGGDLLVSLVRVRVLQSTQVYWLRSLLTTNDPVALVVGVGLLSVLIPIAVFGLFWLVGRALLPRHGPSGAIASLGVFIAAIGAGVTGAVTLVVFVGVAIALVVWDLSNHAVELGQEIGSRTQTTVELVHATGSVALGVAGVGLGVLGLVVAGRIPVVLPRTAPLVLVAALLGFIVFLAAIRAG